MRSRFQWLITFTVFFCLLPAIPVRAQDPNAPADPPSGGWRKFGEPRSAEPPTAPPEAAPPQAPSGYLPPQLNLAAGTFITVRVDQTLSSDHNQPGDTFTATLAQPVIVDGFVLARRGQTIAGRVAEAERAGRVKGGSRLGIELTELSLADGQQVPVRTQLIQYSGGTSHGQDATAIAATTGVGAAIGAAADGGFGAGMGAIAGAAASTIGVLMTRGRATEIYPEALLTFRTLAPVTLSTERSAHAFEAVRQEDYEPKTLQRRASMRQPAWGPYRGGWGYPYPYYYSPFYYGYGYGYGPSFYFSGPRYYRGGGYYGGGHYRRR